MGLPVLLVPVAPAELQNAPAVTGFGGAATVGATGAAGAGGVVTAGTTGSTIGVSGACVGGAGTSIEGGSSASDIVVGVVVAGVDVVVVGVTGIGWVLVVGAGLADIAEDSGFCAESCFGATNPIAMKTATDATNTHPAVRRLPMRAHRTRPRMRPMTEMTTMTIQMRTRTEVSTCMRIPAEEAAARRAAERHRLFTTGRLSTRIRRGLDGVTNRETWCVLVRFVGICDG